MHTVKIQFIAKLLIAGGANVRSAIAAAAVRYEKKFDMFDLFLSNMTMCTHTQSSRKKLSIAARVRSGLPVTSLFDYL